MLGTTFDGDGKVITDLVSGSYDISYDVAIVADGRIVAAGHTQSPGQNENFGITRYKSDGGIDATFGGGVITTDFGSSDSVFALTLDAAGRLIVAGTSNNKFALARYGERLYAQHDANFNFTSVTNSAGTVRERYLYDPYGAVTYKSGTWGTSRRASFRCLRLLRPQQ